MTRNTGLDLIRTVAIMMVIVSHGRFVLNSDSFILGEGLWRLSLFGYFGVELFFVLSGFLIGRIIIESFVSQNSNVKNLLFQFYIRRWFRTLPLYFLILIVNIWFWDYFDQTRSINWMHFVFLQNYDKSASEFFPESWSLAIEEWFYLLFPLFIIGFKKYFCRGIKYDFKYFLICFILFILATRTAFVIYYNPIFDFGVRKNIFFRLDSLAIGVLFAYLSMYNHTLFKKIARLHYFIISIIGILIISAFYWMVNAAGWSESIFARTFMFSIVTIMFGICLTYCYNKDFNYRSFYTMTSKIAYSMYLIHFPIFLFATRFTRSEENLAYKIFIFIIVFVLVYFLSYIVYKYYEKPFMDLRDKIPTFQNTKGV
jgi:peptidoglycan/LPS O-acetylase OafA/YrhL